MEISEQTKNELEAEKHRKFLEWNGKINSYADELINYLKEKQLIMSDLTEVIRIAQEKIGKEVGELNVNYVYNSNNADEILNNKDKQL